MKHQSQRLIVIVLSSLLRACGGITHVFLTTRGILACAFGCVYRVKKVAQLAEVASLELVVFGRW